MAGGPTTRAGNFATEPGTREHRLAWAMLAVFTAVFVLQAAPRISARFGDSHDGRNGGVWGMSGRAIRSDGLVRSRLGARVAAGTPHRRTYANHPPLISLEVAAAQATLGDRHIVTRLPAWLGSIAVVALVYGITRGCGIDPVPAAAGSIFGLGAPMFFVFGGMLDTPVTALPFALGLVLTWQRRINNRRGGTLAPAVLAFLSVFAAWQALILAALLALGALARRRRDLALAVVVGAGVGAGAVLGWVLWTVESLGGLRETLLFRTGSTSHVTLAEMLRAQAIYLEDTLPASALLLAPVALVPVLRRPPCRLVVVPLILTPVLYCLALPGGAYFHSYWAYWLPPGLAVMFGASAAILLQSLERRGARRSVLIGLVALGSLTAGLIGGLRLSAARIDFERGVAAGELAAELHPADCSYVAARFAEPTTWIWYESGAPPCPAERRPPAGARLLAADTATAPPTWPERASLIERKGDYVLLWIPSEKSTDSAVAAAARR